MFRELRRIKKKMEPEILESILNNADYGTMACHGDMGYAYAVPLNYYYDGECIYFHSALSGHKIDAITNNSKVTFSIVNSYKILPESLNTHFESVIVFGKASLLDESLKKDILYRLGMKYAYNFEDNVNKGINKETTVTAIVKIQIEHKEGKISN
ncbi:MAG: pyridoxamine 5'-phosphate oxidase family protein [Clostridiales bacterium]|nr:pyridoxamine 5'-phosphate oxidase family protein [Clostridiales bacterium]